MQIVDTHAHLDFPTSSSQTRLRGTSVDDLDEVLARAKEAGVSKIVTIGTSLEESKKAVEIADSTSSVRLRSGLRGVRKNLPEIYASVGLHPKDAKSDIEEYGLDKTIGTLRSIAQLSNKVVAIGECGLDYYLGSRGQGSGTSEKDKKFQRELFEAQIKLAGELNLPIVIHCRNGWHEIFDLLKTNDEWLKAKGVFHSWTGDWDAAKKALDLGFYISFSGIVTFKNAPGIQEVAKKAPLNRILVETDSPFLSPDPHRGETNEPKNVKMIAQFLADLRGPPLDKIAESTTRNAESIFRIN